jgi:DNA-binding CsgD family transcriptional regulator
VAGEWPLVGRVEELGFVVETFRRGASRGVVIAGALGVGKTRLAREAVAALDGEFAIEWTAATPASASIPFAALAHLLPEVAVTSPEDRLRLMSGIFAVLEERAAGRPLVLAVDDAQWLDVGAAAFIHQLVVTRKARVLLTVRIDEPTPAAIVTCWKDNLAERLELQPLSALDLDVLVAAALARPVDRATVRRFWTLTQGNALFLHELVLGALKSDAFTVSDGVWNWTGDFGSSTRLSVILESRLARVSATGRAVLDHLAVGEPLTLDVLTTLCGVDGVIEVERAGIAVVDAGDEQQVRLSHPMYGEVVRAAMGTLERRRVMVNLADALAKTAESSRGALLRVATWRLDSGSAAPEWLFTEAAEIANAVYDHALAERLARRAMTDGGGFRASLALGESLNRLGRSAEGLAVLEEVADDAQSDRDRVALAVARYFGLTTEYGFRAEFEEVLLAAERKVRDLQLKAFLRAQRATLLCFSGQLDRGIALASAAIGEGPDDVIQLRAGSALGSAWTIGGKPDSACALADRLLGPALRLRDEMPQAPAWILSMHLTALLAAGRLDDIDAAIELVETAISSGAGSADGPSFVALARGMSALHRGQAQTAARWLRESVASMRQVTCWRLPFPLAQLAEACALAGDAEGATAASAEADELVLHHAIHEGLARRARGWAAFAQGCRSAAIDRLVDAAEWARAHGQHTAELFALHDILRLGAAAQAAEQLHATAARSEGRWALVFGAHGFAVTNDDGTALDAAATQFEDMGALLMAAEAAAEASNAFRRSGHRGRAEQAAARAGVLAGACEGARTPLLEELRSPLPLSHREREVVHLAVQGLTSQIIARRLFISVRTVEGHLQKAYGKLGVNDRHGLRNALQRSAAARP